MAGLGSDSRYPSGELVLPLYPVGGLGGVRVLQPAVWVGDGPSVQHLDRRRPDAFLDSESRPTKRYPFPLRQLLAYTSGS